MNREEAASVADAVVAELRELPYATLVERLRDEVEVREVTGPTGVEYQVEIQGWWDGRSGGDLRIVVGADDGTLRGALVPVNRSFVMRPDGSSAGD